MTNASHTKGPWEQADSFGPSANGTGVQKVGGHLICSCTAYFSRDEVYANARLIAAAPELLEALNNFPAAFDYSNAHDFRAAAIGWFEDQARPAINKAEGRP